LLTIWDSKEAPPGGTDLVYTWNGVSESGKVHSLLLFIEKHDVRLRKKYLAWIHELGESVVGRKRVVDHLAIPDSCSYWWMTLFVEKSPWKQPSVTDAIRIFALDEILGQSSPAELKLVSGNVTFHNIISELCRKRKIGYTWERINVDATNSISVKSLYGRLPLFWQGLASMARLVARKWQFRKLTPGPSFSSPQSLFIGSYLFNVDKDALSRNEFYSKYWGQLHQLMHELGLQENWLHIYTPNDAIPDGQAAIRSVRAFNKDNSTHHVLLDSFLDLKIIGQALWQYCRLYKKYISLSGVRPFFQPAGVEFSLWPLMKNDWKRSMTGSVAVVNLLYMGLFDKAMRMTPHQGKGIFLYENQDWERAFIHAWRKHGHGELIAVAHSTVRFWDLRYFFDTRTLLFESVNGLPQADRVALNGPVAIKTYLNSGFPEDRIVPCEAVRYFVYNKNRGHHTPGNRAPSRKVLIVGDYMASGTDKMLRLLEEAVHDLDRPIMFDIKPHPNCPVDAGNYPCLRLTVRTEDLYQILREYDMVYSSNMTTASLDAFLAGIPVLIMLDDADLNFSPMRGIAGASFVSSPAELAEGLQRENSSTSTMGGIEPYFFMNQDLHRWRSILRNPTCTINPAC
jgi:surface carbohydrate biosynthesis protein (TIGR04326 family)